MIQMKTSIVMLQLTENGVSQWLVPKDKLKSVNAKVSWKQKLLPKCFAVI